MGQTLGRLTIKVKTGQEPFRASGKALDFTLSDFWRWSVSDLMSNATRGRLAEFIIARALGASTDDARDEWQAYDLLIPDGVKVEVKSAAYLQSWNQKELSKIVFQTPKTRAWDPDTNVQSKASKRQADVYVFALLAHKDKATVDPLDLDQWRFYVVPTSALDDRKRSQHSITLSSLEKLAGEPIEYKRLCDAVKKAVRRG